MIPKKTTPSRPTITRRSASPKRESSSSSSLEQPLQSTSAPVAIPSKPVAVPLHSQRSQSGGNTKTMQTVRSRGQHGGRRRPTTNADPRHREDALPPAVAALLAVTAIPPPKPNQFRRRMSSNKQNVSIDELVSSWKSEDMLNTKSCSSSLTLSMLLEDNEVIEPRSASPREDYMHHRSTSSDSMPSLEADDQSVHSTASPSPSTPGSSMRSRNSSFNFTTQQKPATKPKHLPQPQDCAHEHPLVRNPLDDDIEDGLLQPTASNTPLNRQPPKPRSTFRSNLTLSLQNLKSAAAKKFSLSPQQQQQPATPNSSPTTGKPRYPDSLLWSHPYLFPRFSSETRPAPTTAPPSRAQRHYLNPPPPQIQNPHHHNHQQPHLTFEEQEAPFQLALHAPYLHNQNQNQNPTNPNTNPTSPPKIRWVALQTYHPHRRNTPKPPTSTRCRSSPSSHNKAPTTRSPASSSSSSSPPPPTSRQREVRENSDFLRVVVLEMNMRRGGKLEVGGAGSGGKARFWLPPRAVETETEAETGTEVGGLGDGDGDGEGRGARVPRRWRGVSA
ncbi:hypothetical protein MBLNU230_g4538t1 [Neophaeotheca triangularis]